MHNPCTIEQQIKTKAQELGFLDCAILSPTGKLSDDEHRLNTWLQNQMHGQMHYMARNTDKRLNPALLTDNLKTIIIVTHNYYTDKTQTDSQAPVISKYAYGTDYHFVLKDKMKHLLHFIQAEITQCTARLFTDSAPILERSLAHRAGLGWIGKNTSLISSTHGSFFFIGEMFLDVELPFQTPHPMRDRCGTCTRCIDACPTRAILPGRVIDARRCISYQTIEVKGTLDEKLKDQFANRVFGCDICQDVCPWNRKAQPHSEPRLAPHPQLLQLTAADWHSLTPPIFNTLFRHTPVQRTGYHRLMRNLRFLQS